MLKLLQQHSKPCVACSTQARLASSPRLVTRVAVILTVLFMLLFIPNNVGADSTEIQADQDCFLHELDPTNPYNTAALNVEGSITVILRPILEFDLSSLPANITMQSATLGLYFYSVDIGSPQGRTYDCQRLVRRDFEETEASWNEYKTGSSWTTAGCGDDGNDYDSTDKAQATVPALNNWMNWNVTAQVSLAYNSTWSADFRISDSIENSASRHNAVFYSGEYSGDTSLRPKLTIIYEPPPSLGLGAVTNFTATQTGVSSCNLTWIIGGNSTSTLIVGSIEHTPTSVTDGYVVYNGSSNVTAIDGLSLVGTTYWWSAWALNTTHASSEYANTSLGGEAMTNVLGLALLAVLALVFTALFFWKQAAILAFGAAGSWALLGFLSLTTSTAESPTEITDIWMGLFWLCMMFTVGCALLPAIMREKPEPGDIYVDNVDCAGDDVSSIMPDPTPEDAERPSQRSKVVYQGRRPGIVKFRR